MKTLRHLTSIDDLTPEEIDIILDLAIELKRERKNGAQRQSLERCTMAMIFEKPSLRTRVTFETGVNDLGGHAIYLAPGDIQIGKRETVADVARNLSRWVHCIVARTFSHETVLGLARYASIPVVNALSDHEHPCQALAFGQMVREERGDLPGTKVVFVGDGNNVAHSLMLLCAKTGMEFVLACPEGYEAEAGVMERCRELGGSVEVTHDPHAAVAGADVIYTDVWASMGQEDEQAKRAEDFAAFQVNDELMASAPSGVIVTHCLPAHRGEEITESVLEGSQCRALEEAENRLHAQKAAVLFLFGVTS